MSIERTISVKMADETTKQICKLSVGDRVIGFNSNTNSIEETEVLSIQHKPEEKSWIKINTTRNSLGSGSSMGRILSTTEHEIWRPGIGPVKAEDLKVGDTVLNCRIDLSLTPIQREILTGKMLGDGSLTHKDGLESPSITFGHKYESYTDWTLQGLQEIAGEKQRTRISGYGTPIFRGRSKQMHSIYREFKDWIACGHKEVPKDICLTPISLAFWYMDDGSLSHFKGQEDRAALATNAFSNESCEYLLRELKKFNIDGSIRDNKGNTIYLNAENAEKLFLLVFPYICKELKYKLPERYRDSPSYLPKESNNQFHKLIIEQKVVKIKKGRLNAQDKWSIKTGTGNIFTSGGLILC